MANDLSNARRRDPYLGNRFRIALEVNGVEEGGFSECSGLVVETEFEERREGGLNGYVHRFPKGTKFTNVILKRGLIDSDRLWQWHQDLVAGQVTALNVSIILRDPAGNDTKWKWHLERAYPVKWTGPEFKADASAVAIETLELAHHGLKKG